jgi:hypothetical protein
MSPFRYFNSSPEVIRLVVMMYVRYPLSLRNVDLLAERGIDISHETRGFWWNRFGPMFAAEADLRGFPQWRSAQSTLRSTAISTKDVISSCAKSTNRGAWLRWPNGARSWPDSHLEFRPIAPTDAMRDRSPILCDKAPSMRFVGVRSLEN